MASDEDPPSLNAADLMLLSAVVSQETHGVASADGRRQQAAASSVAGSTGIPLAEADAATPGLASAPLSTLGPPKPIEGSWDMEPSAISRSASITFPRLQTSGVVNDYGSERMMPLSGLRNRHSINESSLILGSSGRRSLGALGHASSGHSLSRSFHGPSSRLNSSSTALLPNSSLGLMDEDVISSAEGAEDEIDALHTLLHETGDGRLLQPPRAPGATATAAEQMVGGQTTHSRATGSVKAGSGFFVSFTGTAL